MRYLNLGCGSRYHPEWTNVDRRPSGPGVIVYDLRKGIPFPDNAFDAVYHSHLIEHLNRKEAALFLKECFRVLKGDGIIRVAVPDLEVIARHYLTALGKARNDKGWQHNYDWLMLELYDQAVRESSGGAMLEYLSQNPIPNEAFVLDRIGDEARSIIENQRTQAGPGREKTCWPPLFHSSPKPLRNKLYRWLLRGILGKVRYRALQIGLFRSSGEIHHWMYDQHSLSLALEQCGFKHPVKRDAFTSSIRNWKDFFLDAERDGRTYKPDSLFMEALKPLQ
jgi:predicted SAM-dependent methyltransferase